MAANNSRLRIYAVKGLRNGCFLKFLNAYPRKRVSKDVSGQAIAEMIILIPMLIFLCGAAIGVAYMCFQGVKVQAAANYAARIQGQERVAGGDSVTDIDRVNGKHSDSFDEDPDGKDLSEAVKDVAGGDGSDNNVYGRYRTQIRKMFNSGEQTHLFVPRPEIGNEIDRVKVVRIMQPPTIFGFKLNPVKVEGTAYGGEDSNMFALPRFGCATANCGQSDYYWKQPTVLQQDKNGDQNSPLGSK